MEKSKADFRIRYKYDTYRKLNISLNSGNSRLWVLILKSDSKAISVWVEFEVFENITHVPKEGIAKVWFCFNEQKESNLKRIEDEKSGGFAGDDVGYGQWEFIEVMNLETTQ